MSELQRPTWIGVVAGSCLALVAMPATALAHTGQPTSGLWEGLTHPVLGIDHVVAMVTVGLLAVVLHRPVAAPAAFVTAMIVGGALGMLGMPLPAGEMAIAVSIAALGAALIAGQRMRADVALSLVALAGAVHGHAHGLEAPDAAHPALYIGGFVVATAALHATGVLIGLSVRRRPSVRSAMGAVVVGAGLGFLAGVI